MIKKITKWVLLVFALLTIVILGFNRFMKYDRAYAWSKEYKNDITNIAKLNGFMLVRTSQIPIGEINRSSLKIIQLKIQEFLGQFDLMNYGHEFGECISFKSIKSNGIINCKGWCLGDHLIGLEIEYQIEEHIFIKFKADLENQFNDYKIKWTKLSPVVRQIN